MKRTFITSLLLSGILLVSGPDFVQADQRARNPGGSGGSSSGGSSGSGGTSTGSSAVSRGGGSTPWGGGSVSSRPSEPSTSSSSAGRRPARGPGGSGGGGGGNVAVPAYSRPRNGAPITGYAVPRGSVATLPPIISGPIYWGPGDWYFYPWGYGGMAFAYFWDPWMWSGYYGGYGGYSWVDPYWSGGGGGGYGGWDSGGGGQSSTSTQSSNPLDGSGPTGGLRLKVEPREAEVYVDGFFAGHVDDFDGAMQKLKIVEGPHRIELKAPGYETTTFEVNVVAGQTTNYKTELKRH